MLGKHGYPSTIAYLVLHLSHLNSRVVGLSQVLHANHGNLDHPVFAAGHEEKRQDVPVMLLKMLLMLSDPNKIQMLLKI